jgi:translocation and assembly module TamB
LILAQRPLLRRWLIRTGIAVAGIALTLLLLLWAATGPLGRWAVMQLADSREVARGLVLDLDGLSGNVLAQPRLDRLSLSDADGEFLIVDDLHLDWNGLALLSRRVDIDALDAGRIAIARRPSLASTSSAGGGLPAIRMAQINVDTLDLAEPVIGTPARFTLTGEARMREAGVIALNARRTDVEGDRLRADIRWQAAGDLSGTFEAHLAADSPLSGLVGLDGTAASVEGAITGTAARGTGTAVIALSGREVSNLDLDWADGRWTLDADTDADRLPDRFATPFDASSTVRLSGTLSPLRLQGAEIEGRDWQISLRPTAAREFDASLSLSRAFLDTLLPDSVSADRARFNGTLDVRAGITADGVIELSRLDAPGLSAAAAGGGLTLARRNGETSLFADITATEIELPGIDALPRVDWIGLQMEARQSGDTIAIPALSLTSDVATLTAAADILMTGWTASGDMAIAVPEIAVFTDRAAGPLTAELNIATLSRRTARLTASIDAAGLAWPDPRLQPILSGSELSARLETDYDSWTLSGLRLSGDGVLATGEVSGQGANWQAALDGAVSGDVALGPAQLGGGAALALEATGEGRTANADLVITTERISLSGQTLTAPRLGLELTLGENTQTARWQLESGTRFGDLAARGTLDRSATRTQIDINEAAIGPRTFTGQASIDSGRIDARLDGRDWPLSDGDIGSLGLTVRRADESWTITGELSGAFHDPFSLSATARLENRELAADMTGAWGEIPVRTREPILFRFADDDRNVVARFRIGTGGADLRWREDSEFRLILSDLPADLLVAPFAFPDLTGRLDADITLRERQGVWSGEATARLAELHLRRLPDAPPLSLALDATLGETIDASIELTADGLTGSAQLQRRGRPVSGLGQLRDDAPLAGTVTLNGTLEPLLSLLLPETRQLGGQLDLDLQIAGTVYRPLVDGEVRLAEGRYMSENLGVNIETIEGVARFDDGRLRIDSFSARDPSGGTLTASGDIVRGETGFTADNRIEFTDFNAVRRPDLNVIVTGYSDVTLDRSGITIAGEADIDRVDARPPEASAPSFAEIEVTEINRPDGRTRNARNRLPVTLDYRVRADDSIFISGDPFSSEWRGDWHVTGAPTDLEIEGTAELIGGRAVLLNRAFRLERGRVVLDGPVRSASLDLTAVHTRENLTVNARIKGPISAPALSLGSEPTLPEDEILARLLFDQSAGQLSAFQTATIAAQLSGQSIFGLVGNLRRAAGLDRLDFNTTTDGQVVVTGGQRLSDDVYLELESRGAALSSARLEWTLTPDVTLLSRLTGDTEGSIALRWRTEYD